MAGVSVAGKVGREDRLARSALVPLSEALLIFCEQQQTFWSAEPHIEGLALYERDRSASLQPR